MNFKPDFADCGTSFWIGAVCGGVAMLVACICLVFTLYHCKHAREAQLLKKNNADAGTFAQMHKVSKKAGSKSPDLESMSIVNDSSNKSQTFGTNSNQNGEQTEPNLVSYQFKTSTKHKNTNTNATVTTTTDTPSDIDPTSVNSKGPIKINLTLDTLHSGGGNNSNEISSEMNTRQTSNGSMNRQTTQNTDHLTPSFIKQGRNGSNGKVFTYDSAFTNLNLNRNTISNVFDNNNEPETPTTATSLTGTRVVNANVDNNEEISFDASTLLNTRQNTTKRDSQLNVSEFRDNLARTISLLSNNNTNTYNNNNNTNLKSPRLLQHQSTQSLGLQRTLTEETSVTLNALQSAMYERIIEQFINGTDGTIHDDNNVMTGGNDPTSKLEDAISGSNEKSGNNGNNGSKPRVLGLSDAAMFLALTGMASDKIARATSNASNNINNINNNNDNNNVTVNNTINNDNNETNNLSINVSMDNVGTTLINYNNSTNSNYTSNVDLTPNSDLIVTDTELGGSVGASMQFMHGTNLSTHASHDEAKGMAHIWLENSEVINKMIGESVEIMLDSTNMISIKINIEYNYLKKMPFVTIKQAILDKYGNTPSMIVKKIENASMSKNNNNIAAYNYIPNDKDAAKLAQILAFPSASNTKSATLGHKYVGVDNDGIF